VAAVEPPVFESLLLRISLLLILLSCIGSVRAEWTGVAFEIGDVDFDWEFDGDRRVAKANSLSFSIEERTSTGLAVGGAIGYLSMRVDGDETIDRTDFEVENLKVYLRQGFVLSDSFSLYALFDYGYYNGRENTSSERAEINWSEVSLEFGASFRNAGLRITPFVSYADVDGDISRGSFSSIQVFELEDPVSYGIELDIFVEKTAFVSIRLQDGSQSGGYLSFVRRYE
jgi:hypothetical protein